MRASRPFSFCGISIHALCEEGDAPNSTPSTLRTVFLSTPSARRATHHLAHLCAQLEYFYPRPLRGGRRRSQTIGTHTARFLSTPSARRATCKGPDGRFAIHISIHALCEEGDATSSISLMAASIFLSTPSARRATPELGKAVDRLHISIHALCEEGDGTMSARICARFNFYPRPPRGGRPRTRCA